MSKFIVSLEQRNLETMVSLGSGFILFPFKSLQDFLVRRILSACYLMPVTSVNVQYFSFLPLMAVQCITYYI